jgi:uncharacterized protein (TIGR02145 family)
MSLLLRRRIYVKKEEPPYTEIAGIKWADVNLIADPNDVTGMTSIFAERPDMYTDFYQFNRKKAWPATGTVTDFPTTNPTTGDWDTANISCPSGYRLPTIAEFQSLVDSGYKWCDINSIGNEVAGVLFGHNCNRVQDINNLLGSIFLPAAGNRTNTGSIYYQGIQVRYWSSSQYNNIYGLRLYFSSSLSSPNLLYNGKVDALSLRCVKI